MSMKCWPTHTHKKAKIQKDTQIKQLSLINFKSLEKSSLLPNVAKLACLYEELTKHEITWQ